MCPAVCIQQASNNIYTCYLLQRGRTGVLGERKDVMREKENEQDFIVSGTGTRSSSVQY